MKIAQVAPLHESVPPKFYGGTERVVSFLTEALVHQGHEVTLFASGDSVTNARLVPVCPSSLRLDTRCIDPYAHLIRAIEMVFRNAGAFDVLHFHIDYFHFPLSRRHAVPAVTTLHGRLDIPDLTPLYQEFPEMPVVSISDSQRAPLSWINWQATVHHGLPVGHYPFYAEPGRYLAFIGRISPEKGIDCAIEIARRAGIKLIIAAKVDPADREYFATVIKPMLKGRYVEYVGEIGEAEKGEFLGNALALLFPINWPEPFGLAMIEAMACGTPVIANRNGSVPEVVEQGVTGFIVDDINAAVRAVEQVGSLSRLRCQQEFKRRFTADRMARNYHAVYRKLLSASGLSIMDSALAQITEEARPSGSH
jgi:glycosyltransferase involved in cell wall biosynthesis